jgi:eukaryotic-like serine/threonine-protein kinase
VSVAQSLRRPGLGATDSSPSSLIIHGIVALAPGARLGVYEVLAQIGEGGMGQVYRARDTRLNRDVALKVLPDSFANDPERLARLTGEARTLASLNHPNIAGIHGLEESGGVRALVMELVEGADLSQRIARAAIPLDQALAIAKQIAEALEAAHEQGIIHRDLKPANIRVRPDGAVKVLDFGLAKAMEPAGVMSPGVSQAPTITTPAMTRTGTILGTAAYMSPEQACGQAVDKRADIWAFGCVLYEMLTGRAAFGGPTLSETLAAVLGRDADLRALPAATPTGIGRLLKRCFEKDPKRRLRDIGEARIECDARIQDGGRSDSLVPTQPQAGTKTRVYTVAAILASLVIGSIAGLFLRPAPPDLPEIRLQIETPGGNVTRFALSPDGRTIVFQATVDGRTQLWLRPLESEEAQPLPGTDNAVNPFWSPDSQSVAFFVDSVLKRIDVTGGAPVTLGSVGSNGGLGATWGRNGTILFVPGNTGPVYRLPAAGGKAAAATQVDPPRITAHWRPSFLSDGRHFLFYGLGELEQWGVYVGALDSKEAHRLFDSDAEAVFRPPDLVLHARQGALVAQRVDLKTWQPVGDPFPVANAVATDFLTGGEAAISSSDAGPIAYRAAGPQRQFVWVDRRGNEVDTVGTPDTARVGVPRASPDNRTVAFTRAIGKYQDVWLIEGAGGVLRKFTFNAGNKVGQLWAPDGRRIVFAWDRQGVLDLYEKPVDATADPTLLLSSAASKTALDWSPNGQFVLYASGGDLRAVPLAGARKPIDVAHTPFSEGPGRFSPDGHWVAYQSNESGRFEIYVQPFPDGRLKKQITSGGGVSPQWSAGGHELFYVSGNRLMVVPIRSSASSVEAGRPLVLFALPPGSSYDVSRDGQRFLVSKVVKEAPPITVLLNWKPR